MRWRGTWRKKNRQIKEEDRNGVPWDKDVKKGKRKSKERGNKNVNENDVEKESQGKKQTVEQERGECGERLQKWRGREKKRN